MRFVIITGVSGAGKSQTVKILEDIGFFCVDNLPPIFIPKMAQICLQSRGKIDKIAVVIDVRGREFLNDFFPGLEWLAKHGIKYEIVFLESSDEILIKRFKESRRVHPLSPEGRISIGLDEERLLLKDIKSSANHVIDTSNLSTRQLKEHIISVFKDDSIFKGLLTNIISFGFKYGVPSECDLVFDVRFIPNPYYIEPMRLQTGKDEDVKNYVLGADETKEFLKKLNEMLRFLIPNYIREGKLQLVIGIGCTGGKHRSVAIAESIYKTLEDKHYKAFIEHRDIEKDNRSLNK